MNWLRYDGLLGNKMISLGNLDGAGVREMLHESWVEDRIQMTRSLLYC
jgi:hypothetical protein